MAETPLVRFIDVRRTIGFYGATQALTDVPIVMAQLALSHPRSSQVVSELDITFGLSEDPTDLRLEFFLMNVDIDNIPSITALRANAQWQAAQNWRSLSAVGVCQTFTRETNDFWNPPVFQNYSLETRKRRMASVLMGWSFATPLAHVQGSAVVSQRLEQRTWRNDNTFADFDEEDEDDQLGSDDGNN